MSEPSLFAMLCCCGPHDEEMVLTEVPSAHVLDKESRVVVPGPLTCGSFKVTLTLTDQVPKQLGLKVDNSDERGSMIMGITEGVVEHFNLQNPERALSVYDRILTVDGEPTTITEVHRLRMSSLAKEGANSLELLVSRPQVLTVSLKKQGSLGLKMKYSAASAGIIIDSVLPDGLIADWNQSHPKQIAPGDRIIALDGVTLAGKSMLEELKVRLGHMGLNIDLSILHYDIL
mmetsp:Transcript_60977/g.123723  ORF Transcript_60977/g.123723 Transcript_60977/m.123723 type:complete len:231 (+) Transcript_60977:56-748(+)